MKPGQYQILESGRFLILDPHFFIKPLCALSRYWGSPDLKALGPNGGWIIVQSRCYFDDWYTFDGMCSIYDIKFNYE